jgi:hypothetical protein
MTPLEDCYLYCRHVQFSARLGDHRAEATAGECAAYIAEVIAKTGGMSEECRRKAEEMRAGRKR